MFITKEEELKKYEQRKRVWQGIPGIEVTKKGRIFSIFYSGGVREEIGNFCVLTISEDGEHFSEPVAVAYLENHRCYDPCLWIDPLDRLWMIWSIMPDNAVYGVICDDPDAEKLSWGEPFMIGHDVMLNKPTVLSTGEWLFPIAVWKKEIKGEIVEYDFDADDCSREAGAFVYRTIDNGKTFEIIGGADVENRSYDEHMILELQDGRIASYVRTKYGIGVAYSFDFGRTWTKGEDSNLGGPCSRFAIRRLKSGRILLINHVDFDGRNNMMALLSDDECTSWKYSLMLDERNDVSYPDFVEAEDGYIYITYDRERGCFKNSFDEVYACAREILYAKITEKDIMAGELVNPNSKLKCIISKLGEYEGNVDKIFLNETDKLTDEEIAEYYIEKFPNKILEKIFERYNINCVNMHKLENDKLDRLIERIDGEKESKKQTAIEIITLIRSVSDITVDQFPIVSLVKKIIMENLQSDLSIDEISDKIGTSRYYLMHQFKKITGMSIVKYRNALKISCAKNLLIHTDKSMAEIAQECGYTDSSYFSKLFIQSEKISPTAYRTQLKHK